MTFGFIITRHVNSEQTNKYWNHSLKLLRTLYPNNTIVIIDDNSNYDYVKAFHNYKNIIVIQSTYPKRGELLPYIYYLRNKWFDNAVILHDSTFIHKYIPFDKFKLPVLPLWHHAYDKENLTNLLRLSHNLMNNRVLKKKLVNNDLNVLGMPNLNKFDLCFGAQCYINYDFLNNIEKKYSLSNLLKVVTNRTDRCSFERIIGLLFFVEFNDIIKTRSLFGDIMYHHKSFGYDFNEYISDFYGKRLKQIVVKVWTGR
jgi:hypothetical protein